MARKIPELSQRPKSIRGKVPNWYIANRYFDIGEEICWREDFGKKIQKGVITKITVNLYGRVSYYVGDKEVILEDIVCARKGDARVLNSSSRQILHKFQLLSEWKEQCGN